jgi:hypothetical protein
MASGYTEQIFTTDNTKLVAVLLTFGAKLSRHMPLEWVNVFKDRADYIESRRNPNYKSKVVVTFNIDLLSTNVKAIAEAYHHGENNEDKFTSLVNGSGLDSALVAELLKLHSFAVVSACREALEAREYLVSLMKQVPDSAKWNHVHGTGRGQFARFGRNASKETVADMLDKIK